MALILCLETSSVNCSVALFQGEKLLAAKEAGETYIHAEKLHVFIQEVLRLTGVKASELQAIAVGEGPGSFTGLRIGVAAAKGLCYATSARLIAVSSLKTLWQQVVFENPEIRADLFVPMVDARRMEVYTAVFGGNGEEVKRAIPMLLNEQSYMTEMEKGTVCFFGDGMPKWRNLKSNPNATYVDGILPSARFMIQDAFQKFNAQEFSDVAYFEPLYLKDWQPTTPKKIL